MTKRIKIGGMYYRKRRGVLVPIPIHWVGDTIHPQTRKKRKHRRKKNRNVRKLPIPSEEV